MNIWELENRTRELIKEFKRAKEEESMNERVKNLADATLPVLENYLKVIQKLR